MSFLSPVTNFVGSTLNELLGATDMQANAQQYSTEMSNTAYQRAVEDMRKAGLNPALAGTNASPASTPPGSGGAGAGGAMISALPALINSFATVKKTLADADSAKEIARSNAILNDAKSQAYNHLTPLEKRSLGYETLFPRESSLGGGFVNTLRSLFHEGSIDDPDKVYGDRNSAKDNSPGFLDKLKKAFNSGPSSAEVYRHF